MFIGDKNGIHTFMEFDRLLPADVRCYSKFGKGGSIVVQVVDRLAHIHNALQS